MIKFGGARRALFLVDRFNLGEQAEKEFENYRTPDDRRKFTVPGYAAARVSVSQAAAWTARAGVGSNAEPVAHVAECSRPVT